MNIMKWKRQVHQGWKEIMDAELSIGGDTFHNLIYKWQYVSLGKKRYSIIGPSKVTFGQWEAYNGDDILRFKTLKEAKAYCETNNDF